MSDKHSRPKQLICGLLAPLLAVTLLSYAGERPVGQSKPDWLVELEAGQRPTGATVQAPNPLKRITPAKSVAAPPAKFEFPAAASWRAEPGKADGRPVRLASGEPAQVEILDRAVAQRMGASGFVFKMTGAGRAEVLIDYSGFAQAYGAGYGDRLRVVSLPDCAASGCEAVGTPVESANDPAARTLTVSVRDLAKSSTFAVISAVGGDVGTYAASDMSMSSSWQVAPGSGAFTYSYPIAVPEPASGAAPAVSLNYSSAAIDGLTLARNTQASAAGIGWSDFANAYIERQYEPCIHTLGTTDLCWMSENATISLSGISGPLLPVNSSFTEWRAQSDPGWKVERLTGAPYTTVHQGQYWKVTGPDGTQYFFGYGHMPGRQTGSILAVSVVGDRLGEPCYDTQNNRVGGCDQGWRWYLDRVVDPDGNVQTYLYEREDNWYYTQLGALGGKPMSKYHRGALLKEIIYGGRNDTWNASLYSARITFGLQWRCGFLVEACPEATKDHSGFPDVPTDLICAETGGCTNTAPSFFVARRYAWVRTEVRIGNTGRPEDWKGVAQHNILHRFSTGTDLALKLEVLGLQHAAIAFGKLDAYPTTTFDYVAKRNRVDFGTSQTKAMWHHRISKITNPFGGVVTVAYFTNRTCEASYNAYPRWDLNDRDCFPQSIKDGTHLRTGVFHKYLVQQVTEQPGVGSPNMTTTYAYQENPAWAFDTGAFSRDEDELGWSVWRGYRTVLITKGTGRTKLRLFRGLDGDKAMQIDGGQWVPTGRRTESVPTLDTWQPTSYVDYPTLIGRVLEEVQLGTLNGVADSVLSGRRHEYERRITFNAPDEYRYDPEWAGLTATTETLYSAPGVYKQRRSVTGHNANLQPATTLEEGWLGVPGDERCSLTTYALYSYPAVNKVVAGDCTSTQVLSHSETSYDPRGNPIRQRILLEGSRWAETRTEYDPLGRPTRVTDPNGGVSTTTYTVTAGSPFTQIPIQTTETNALNQSVVTDYHPQFGVPSRVRDINGNVTDYTYDEFGRLTGVWLPTEPLAFAEPSWKFIYDVEARVVKSMRLTSEARTGAVTFDETWVVYDGFWRERQQQVTSPATGKVLISETTYDNRGLGRDRTVEQAFTGTAGRYVNGGDAWLNRTRLTHDELGRQVRSEWMRGGAVAHATSTQYDVDQVTVTGPDGRRVRERVDAYGRTVSVQEHDGTTWVGSNYTYDLADRLTAVADPAGNRTTYASNLAGWRTAQQDPDRGTASYTYDNAGNQLSASDALGNQIHTRYDALGRPVQRRAGSPTGTPLATWEYDAAPGGKGKPHRVITHTTGGDWIAETTGYDSKGRPGGQKFVVPAGIAGLSGSYTVTQTYDRADRVRTIAYPTMFGLPAETVTLDYNAFGMATRMAGAEEYVWGAVYDDRGRRASIGAGPRPGGATWMSKRWTYDVDQRINGTETLIGTTVVSDHETVFDLGGNPAEKLTRRGGQAWRECFDYDQRGRLSAAHTVAASSTCDSGTAGTGDNPYVQAYGYSPDGKLLWRQENSVRTDYAYPAAGATRPHAPTSVGGTAYSWNPNGSLASRGGETFAWDVQGMLQSVTGNGATTSFVYDASGRRLLRRTPDGLVTLFIGGHEVTANASGQIVNAVRPYTFEGQLVATRSLRGVDYMVTDAAGSVELTFRSGQSASASARAYAPYGRVRAQTGDTDSDRGFLGQIEDSTTGLSYLNARYYDPAQALFLSADPLYDTGKVKSLNPYTYSAGNPVSFADPSGLMSAYTWGVETENGQLRQINSELLAHIGRMNSHIEYLNSVIVKHQKTINKLVSYARALEAEIARQALLIHRLQARVAYLERVVIAQRREITRLRRVAATLYVYAVLQSIVIGVQRSIIARLGVRMGAGRGAAAGLTGGSLGRLPDIRGVGKAVQSHCSRDVISWDCVSETSLDAAGSVWGEAADLAGGRETYCGKGVTCVSDSWLIVPWADGGTLGDTVVCADYCNQELAAHERVHVAQQDKYGVAFLFMYFYESMRDGIKCDNGLERPAYEAGLGCD